MSARSHEVGAVTLPFAVAVVEQITKTANGFRESGKVSIR